MTPRENISLKKLNSFGIEVSARYYYEIHNEEDFRELFSPGEFHSLPHLILGGGSNILFTRDYAGSVVKIMLKGKKIVEQNKDHVIVEFKAGEDWDELVQWAVGNGWGGLENLSLIPGQAGTSPVQNIGAYGVELKDICHSLRAYEKQTGKIHTFQPEECDFGYRHSIFKGSARDRFIILSVQFRLTTSAHRINTQYGAIARELQLMGIESPGIADVRTAVCNIRNSKLPDPAITGNAGSFFKNPLVEMKDFLRLKEQHPDIVGFAAGDKMKLAAGWMIEKAGWKGFRKGDAGVHQHQALVIVNHGNAQGMDIAWLAQRILVSVNELFDVILVPEVTII